MCPVRGLKRPRNNRLAGRELLSANAHRGSDSVEGTPTGPGGKSVQPRYPPGRYNRTVENDDFGNWTSEIHVRAEGRPDASARFNARLPRSLAGGYVFYHCGQHELHLSSGEESSAANADRDELRWRFASAKARFDPKLDRRVGGADIPGDPRRFRMAAACRCSAGRGQEPIQKSTTNGRTRAPGEDEPNDRLW